MIKTAKTLFQSIPNWEWWRYASYRLGVGIFIYFCVNAGIILILTLSGFTLGLAALFSVIPVSVIIAVNISRTIAEKTMVNQGDE